MEVAKDSYISINFYFVENKCIFYFKILLKRNLTVGYKPEFVTTTYTYRYKEK
jgi:hypothetical protein